MNLYVNIKTINKFKFGIALSIAWIAFSSFIYFDTLMKYPNSYVEFLNLGLGDYFDWEDDIERRDDALAYAKMQGNEGQAKYFLDIGFRFLKPKFSYKKYLDLLFLPIAIVLLVSYIALWGRKYLIMGIIGYLIFLSSNGLAPLFNVYVLFCICIFIFLLIVKAGFYELSYIFHKAKEDANRESRII